MKVRWTQGSVRLRITPAELAALERGETVTEEIAPGGWRAVLEVSEGATHLEIAGIAVRLTLSHTDWRALSEPEREGVYFSENEPRPLRYYVEKDFPCVHPRAVDALEPKTETFDAPLGFAEKKNPGNR
jgi:hypothetical protein